MTSPYRLTVDDQEGFRDAYNTDDMVIANTPPRYYHAVISNNDVIFDTQATDAHPYLVIPGTEFREILGDLAIPYAGGPQVIRVEPSDEFIEGEITEWIDEQPDLQRFPTLTRR